jgi:hypothetical protein
MAIQNEKQRAGEHLIQPNWDISRENVTVKLAEVLVAGQLVQEDTPAAPGVKRVVVAYAGGTAIGVLWDDVDATDVAGIGVIHVRMQQFSKSKLVGLDAAAEAAFLASPAQIVIRET